MSTNFLFISILFTFLLSGCEQSNHSSNSKNIDQILSSDFEKKNKTTFYQESEGTVIDFIKVEIDSKDEIIVTPNIKKEIETISQPKFSMGMTVFARKPRKGENPDYVEGPDIGSLIVISVRYLGDTIVDIFSSGYDGAPASDKGNYLSLESARQYHSRTENQPNARRSNNTKNTQESYSTLQEAKDAFNKEEESIKKISKNNIEKIQGSVEKIKKIINSSASNHIDEIKGIIVQTEGLIGIVESLPERQFNTDPYSVLGREIRNLNNLANYAQRQLDDGDVPEKSTRQKLLNMARNTIVLADQYADSGQINEYEAAKEITTALLDITLSVTPVVGWGKDCYEAISGKNLLTGEKLSNFDRTAAWLGAVTGGIGSKVVGGIGVAAVIFTKIGKKIDQSDEFADVLTQGNKIVDSAKKTGDGAQDAIAFANSLSKNADEVIAVINSTVAVGVTSGSRFKAVVNFLHDHLVNIDRLRINRAGDRVFLSLDGKRKVRFDINNPHGDIPHMHLQKLDAAGNWVDEVDGKHRIRFDGN